MPRSQIDEYTAFVGRYGAKGLAYVKKGQRSRAGSCWLTVAPVLLKFLSDAAVEGILTRTAASTGDLIFFGADKTKVVNDSLGASWRLEGRR
jgi:aspartyl-tRNA synthetase